MTHPNGHLSRVSVKLSQIFHQHTNTPPETAKMQDERKPKTALGVGCDWRL